MVIDVINGLTIAEKTILLQAIRWRIDNRTATTYIRK